MLIGPSSSAVVAVRGGDRRTYLHDVTTQRFDDVVAGDVRSALVLDVHGAPLAAFELLAADDEDRLVVPTAAVDHVLEVLARRTFLADARFERVDDRVVSLRGDDVDDLLRAAGFAVEPGTWVDLDGAAIARHGFGAELLGGDERVSHVIAGLVASGADEVDAATLADARVAGGEPEVGREIVGPHLPEELGLLPTHVHLAKGCYPGQEAVARMWMLGRPRRRLASVAWSGGILPGRELGEGRQRVVVTATSAQGRGLAFVPADASPGDRYGDEGDEIVVLAFVGGDTPPPGHDPAVARRRDRKTTGGRQARKP